MKRGPEWRRLRLAVFERDGWRCRKCGLARRLECDHVKPLRQGGAMWDMENLQTLCVNCHKEKSRREARPEGASMQAWRAFLKKELDICAIL